MEQFCVNQLLLRDTFDQLGIKYSRIYTKLMRSECAQISSVKHPRVRMTLTTFPSCVHSTREHVTPEMNKLRQSLRRKKPTYVPEASRPHQWQADEEAVRKGKCNFPVRVSVSSPGGTFLTSYV